MVEKMDDHAVYTKLNPHPPEMDVLPTTFFKPCLAATVNGFASFKYVPQPAATTICIYPYSMT